MACSEAGTGREAGSTDETAPAGVVLSVLIGGAMRRGTAVLVIPILIGSVALVIWLCAKRQTRQQQPIVDRRPDLRRLVAEQEAESAQAVVKYQPKTQDRIDDLDISVVD